MAVNDRQLKTGKFDIRLSEHELGLISEAAKISHTTVSAFVRQRAVEAAENIILDQTRFVLTTEQWKVLDAAFSEPPCILPQLQSKLAKSDPWDDK